ncbi:MAG: AEC family transporter, partial [Bacteroidales bacterium]
MNTLFGQTFISIFGGLLNIFIIAALAALLTRWKIVTQQMIDGLSRLVVVIFLPFLIFHTITQEFDPSVQSYWWTIPIAAISLSSLGIFISYFLFYKKTAEKKYLFPLASMQNAAYLILPIGEFVYNDQFEEFALICFLVVLGLSPFMWTIGKLLLTRDKTKCPGIKKILTPPFIANILSLFLVLSGLSPHIPGFVVDATGFLGNATVPLATFILGATLAISLSNIPPFVDTIRVLGVKFLFLPIITILALNFFDTSQTFPLLADVLVIQSASAPATAHIL